MAQQTPDTATTAWAMVGDRLVFLDVAGDRYFCLGEDDNHRFAADVASGQVPDSFQPEHLVRPADWRTPCRTSPAMEAGMFRLEEVARALWLQRRAEKRLATEGFGSALGDLSEILGSMREPCGSMTASGRACVRGFEHARLLRSAADRCLPRSIALTLGLATRGIRTNLVIAVKTAPFAAHCWVQHGSDVLNDSVEEVRRYHPLLVL